MPPPLVDCSGQYKQEQRHDLKRQATNHDIHAGLSHCRGLLGQPSCRGRDSASSGLQDETDKIARHEND